MGLFTTVTAVERPVDFRLPTRLVFEEKRHRYTVEGQPVPSVTTIIEPMFSRGSEFMEEHHRKRGTAVHRACNAWHRGTLDFEGTHPLIVPYVYSFMRWCEAIGFTPLLIEQPIHYNVYYAGTLDYFGHDKHGEPILLDVKSGAPARKFALQLAGYQHAAADLFGAEYNKARRLSLHLDRNGGTPTPKWYTNPSDLTVFLGLVNAYSWGMQHGYLGVPETEEVDPS